MDEANSLHCARLPDPVAALGTATNLLRRVRPFANYPFGRFANVLMGQILREHYVFTLAGDRPVGYVGWAMCSEETARHWVDGRHVPNFEECRSGPCWVGFTFFASTPEACWAQARWCRQQYPNTKVFAIRDYGRSQRPTTLTSGPARREKPASPWLAYCRDDEWQPAEQISLWDHGLLATA